MKKILLILTLFFLSIQAYSQFDSVIFKKDCYLIWEARNNVCKLGDVNNDGYDDILIYDCALKSALIFLGGNLIDTIPKYTIQFNDVFPRFGGVVALDINDDGFNDIVFSTLKTIEGYPKPGDIRIYYGGTKINTFPSLIFNTPQGASENFGGIYLLNDFNGDGRSEFVIWDLKLPFCSGYKLFGTNYFYNTESAFDTIPKYIIQGDSVKGIFIYPISSSGDINGDGKTDFAITCADSSGGRHKVFKNFYLGNSDFDLTPSVTYYQDSIGFELSYTSAMKIIKDMNGDGKDDILMNAYGKVYPYYYGNSILWGSYPIDTIQDVGLNTQGSSIDYEAGAGDINGDGKNDLFVRMNPGFGYPNVKIWLGGRQMPYQIDDVADKTWYGGEHGIGRQIAAVGDVNGDGVNDICIQQISYYNGLSSECYPGRVYIIKGDTSAKGDTATAVVRNENNLPIDYVFEEPYPNPFNPSTVVSYQLLVRSRVTLTVFDLSGREITVLVDEEQEAGKHRREFNTERQNLSSGVYLVEMRVYKNNSLVFKQTKKLSLIK